MHERRFFPPKDKKAILETLTSEGSPFGELRDALFFAALVGWSMGKTEPLAAKGEGIRWEVMNNRLGTEVMASILAYAHTGDPEIVAKDRTSDRIAILEEFANAGLGELARYLADSSGSVTESLLAMIQRHLESRGDGDGGIDLAKAALTL